MLIRMCSTHRGSEDGFKVKVYQKDMEYDLPHSLAAYFLNKGWAYNTEPFEPANID